MISDSAVGTRPARAKRSSGSQPITSAIFRSLSSPGFQSSVSTFDRKVGLTLIFLAISRRLRPFASRSRRMNAPNFSLPLLITPRSRRLFRCSFTRDSAARQPSTKHALGTVHRPLTPNVERLPSPRPDRLLLAYRVLPLCTERDQG